MGWYEQDLLAEVLEGTDLGRRYCQAGAIELRMFDLRKTPLHLIVKRQHILHDLLPAELVSLPLDFFRESNRMGDHLTPSDECQVE